MVKNVEACTTALRWVLSRVSVLLSGENDTHAANNNCWKVTNPRTAGRSRPITQRTVGWPNKPHIFLKVMHPNRNTVKWLHRKKTDPLLRHEISLVYKQPKLCQRCGVVKCRWIIQASGCIYTWSWNCTEWPLQWWLKRSQARSPSDLHAPSKNAGICTKYQFSPHLMYTTSCLPVSLASDSPSHPNQRRQLNEEACKQVNKNSPNQKCAIQQGWYKNYRRVDKTWTALQCAHFMQWRVWWWPLWALEHCLAPMVLVTHLSPN